jgi:hypothetical protein
MGPLATWARLVVSVFGLTILVGCRLSYSETRRWPSPDNQLDAVEVSGALGVLSLSSSLHRNIYIVKSGEPWVGGSRVASFQFPKGAQHVQLSAVWSTPSELTLRSSGAREAGLSSPEISVGARVVRLALEAVP